jgi:hypothetical protein
MLQLEKQNFKSLASTQTNKAKFLLFFQENFEKILKILNRVCKILLNLNTSITVLKSRNTSIEQY